MVREKGVPGLQAQGAALHAPGSEREGLVAAGRIDEEELGINRRPLDTLDCYYVYVHPVQFRAVLLFFLELYGFPDPFSIRISPPSNYPPKIPSNLHPS